jgi:hypothetical protein
MWALGKSHGTAIMSVVILASSINVGVEIECSAQDAGDCTNIAGTMEYVFCTIFVIEMVVGCAIHGRSILHMQWARFDAFLIAITALSLSISPIVTALNPSNDLELWFMVISQATILRTLRLLRLLRFLRLIDYFQETWKLARGLMSSLRTVLGACVMVAVTVYVFGCLGMELVNHNTFLQEDVDSAEVIHQNFSSLGITMLTLFQFALGDGTVDVYWPIVLRAWYMLFYFLAVWLVLTVVLMNLITAVIVDNAIVQGGHDREMRHRTLRRQVHKFRPFILRMFREFDSDGDGALSSEEFKEGMPRVIEAMRSNKFGDVPPELQDVIRLDQLENMFDWIDADKSGTVDETEFVDSISYLAVKDMPTETIQMMHLLRTQGRLLDKIVADSKEHGAMLASIQQRGPAPGCQGEASQPAPAPTTWAL